MLPQNDILTLRPSYSLQEGSILFWKLREDFKKVNSYMDDVVKEFDSATQRIV
jgi:hypothetical protein